MVQVIMLIINLSQFLLMNFAYTATPSGKESSQSFKVGVAIFLEEGKCYWCRDYHLLHVRHLVRIYDIYLRLWGLRPVLALNYKDL